LLFWFLFVLVFFSLASTKLHHYILFSYPAIAILLAHVCSEEYLRKVLILSVSTLLLILALLYLYEGKRFTPRASTIVRDYEGEVYFYKAEDSALVFYSGRCITNLESPEKAKGLVITREKHQGEFSLCQTVLKGKEFDGVYLLLVCKGKE
ncbi:MAG: glycosyltransferase family 39 protein, partial [Candidatus Kryptonium sp.]